MDRRVTPPKRVTSPTWGPPSPCKQALKYRNRGPELYWGLRGGWVGLEMRPIIQSPKIRNESNGTGICFSSWSRSCFYFSTADHVKHVHREKVNTLKINNFTAGGKDQNRATNSIFGVDFKNFNMISSVVVCFTLLSSSVWCFNHLLKHATINANMLRWPASKLFHHLDVTTVCFSSRERE